MPRIHRSAAQLEPLDLAGRGLRQLGKKFDPARIFVRREALLHMLLKRPLQRLRGTLPWLQYDIGLGLAELLLAFMPDDGGFQPRVVRDERRLDFRRRHPDTRDLQHVIGAAAVGVEAIRIDAVLVAALGPAADERAAALLAVVPVVGRRRRTGDLQLAEFALLHRIALLVDEAQLIARHRLAGRAVAQVAGPIGKENVQHLRRADTVEDVDAGSLLEALRDLRRQRFARGDAGAQRQAFLFRKVGGCEHRRVQGWYAEEDGRFSAYKIAKYRGGRGSLRHEDRGSACIESK